MPIPLGEGDVFTNTGRRAVAISPDGSHIVYSENRALTLRPVDRLQGTMIAGTDGEPRGGPRNPFFSPDGQWIGYEAGGQLKKVALGGGAPITLGELDFIWGGSWGADDMILLGKGADGIWQVPGSGGTPEQLITVEDGEQAHGPQILPGGEWVLFTLRPADTGFWDAAHIVAQSLATGERRVLIEGGRDARYVATGHLVYVLNGVLFAVPFDAGTRAVTGGAVSLVEGIQDAGGITGATHFSVSNTGSLVYIPGGAGTAIRIDLVWVDRSGEMESIGAETRDYQHARVSPDGTRLALEVRDGTGVSDIWIYDLTRAALTRLTFDDVDDEFSLWTPDSSRVVFASDRDGGGLFWKAADGTGDVEQLLASANNPRSPTWAADGRLVFEQSPGDIGVLTLDDERTMELLLDTDFREVAPAISPDGRWLAYQSNESGQYEIFVRPFPNVNEGKWQVSNPGGGEPVWSPDGQELFFIGASPPSLSVVQVETEPTFKPTTAERLFGVDSFRNRQGREWDSAPDGDRFVFLTTSAGAQTDDAVPLSGLVFVEHWFEELKARVPTGR